MNNLQEQLDKTLNLYVGLQFDIDTDDFSDGTLERFNILKEELTFLIKSTCLEIIGEDEPRSNYEFGNVCGAAWQQANWTRQAQREHLNNLLGE